MKIVYRSLDGRYSDNPRALHEALVARDDAHEHVWMCAPGKESELPAGTASVAMDGPDAVAALVGGRGGNDGGPGPRVGTEPPSSYGCRRRP